MKQEYAYLRNTGERKLNRKERNTIFKEGNKINSLLNLIEKEFISIWLDEDSGIEWDVLYNTYKQKFTLAMDKLSKNLKYFSLNREYFSRQYRKID